MSKAVLSSALLVGALLALAGLTGCGPEEAPQDPAKLENTNWEAAQYATDEGLVEPSLLGAMEGRILTLDLASDGGASGTASGSSGVNTFTGQWRADEQGTFDLGPLATTKMAGPAPLMQQEVAYLAALDRAEQFALSADTLELLDAQGDVVVILRPAAPGPALEGTLWRCTGYNNGQEAFVSVLLGTEITTEFDGGQLSGNATVNAIEGSYTFDGSALKVTSASTATQTEGPPEQMDQESAYLAMLPLIKRYKIVGEALTVYGAGDLRLAMYEIAR